jgi:hypothetical protein
MCIFLQPFRQTMQCKIIHLYIHQRETSLPKPFGKPHSYIVHLSQVSNSPWPRIHRSRTQQKIYIPSFLSHSLSLFGVGEPTDRTNRTAHPSTQSSTSPPKTYSQTPSSPISDSPHYAPRTSRCRTRRDSTTAAHYLAHSSRRGNRPRIPSKGTDGKRVVGRSPFRTVGRAWRSVGRRL